MPWELSFEINIVSLINCETILATFKKHLDCLHVLKNRGYIYKLFLASFLLLNHSFLLGWLVELKKRRGM